MEADIFMSAVLTHSRGRRSSLGHFTEVLKVSGGFGRLTLFFDPPPVFLLLLLQVLQTLSDRRAAQLEEEGDVRERQGLVRMRVVGAEGGMTTALTHMNPLSSVMSLY